MKKHLLNGQEATEFVLISILVFFSALAVVFLFGNKLANFFNSESSVARSAKKTTVSANNPKYDNIIDPYTGPTVSASSSTEATATTGGATTSPVTTTTIGGQQVTQNTDGSYTFAAQGQNVTITSDMANFANSVMETTGSSGIQDLVKEVAYMVNATKSDYPASSVPVEVLFGSGNRYYTGLSYSGNATSLANSYTVKVGNKIVVVQKDQSYTGNGTFTGQYRIEGTIGANNTFNGKVTSVNTPYNPSGTYTATIDKTKGFALKDGYYLQKDELNKNLVADYYWDLEFNSNNSFKL